MNSKSIWKWNLATGIAFWVAALLSLTNMQYSSSIIYVTCGLVFIISSRMNYKKTKKTNT